MKLGLNRLSPFQNGGIAIHPTVLPVFDSVGVISTVRKERAVEAKA
ncbi:hypothetical protein VCR8J2_840071 [Vibrio coralliirubri]|nr:hypothetical protein VCR8J2_840071 [Vibrio coralliirubri]